MNRGYLVSKVDRYTHELSYMIGLQVEYKIIKKNMRRICRRIDLSWIKIVSDTRLWRSKWTSLWVPSLGLGLMVC